MFHVLRLCSSALRHTSLFNHMDGKCGHYESLEETLNGALASASAATTNMSDAGSNPYRNVRVSVTTAAGGAAEVSLSTSRVVVRSTSAVPPAATTRHSRRRRDGGGSVETSCYEASQGVGSALASLPVAHRHTEKNHQDDGLTAVALVEPSAFLSDGDHDVHNRSNEVEASTLSGAFESFKARARSLQKGWASGTQRVGGEGSWSQHRDDRRQRRKHHRRRGDMFSRHRVFQTYNDPLEERAFVTYLVAHRLLPIAYVIVATVIEAVLLVFYAWTDVFPATPHTIGFTTLYTCGSAAWLVAFVVLFRLRNAYEVLLAEEKRQLAGGTAETGRGVDSQHEPTTMQTSEMPSRGVPSLPAAVEELPPLVVEPVLDKTPIRDAIRRNGSMAELCTLIVYLGNLAYVCGMFRNRRLSCYDADSAVHKADETICADSIQLEAVALIVMTGAQVLVPIRWPLFVIANTLLGCGVCLFPFTSSEKIPMTRRAQLLLMGIVLVVWWLTVVMCVLRELSRRRDFELIVKLQHRALELHSVKTQAAFTFSALVPMKAILDGVVRDAHGLYAFRRESLVCVVHIEGLDLWVTQRSPADAVEMWKSVLRTVEETKSQCVASVMPHSLLYIEQGDSCILVDDCRSHPSTASVAPTMLGFAMAAVCRVADCIDDHEELVMRTHHSTFLTPCTVVERATIIAGLSPRASVAIGPSAGQMLRSSKHVVAVGAAVWDAHRNLDGWEWYDSPNVPDDVDANILPVVIMTPEFAVVAGIAATDQVQLQVPMVIATSYAAAPSPPPAWGDASCMPHAMPVAAQRSLFIHIRKASTRGGAEGASGTTFTTDHEGALVDAAPNSGADATASPQHQTSPPALTSAVGETKEGVTSMHHDTAFDGSDRAASRQPLNVAFTAVWGKTEVGLSFSDVTMEAQYRSDRMSSFHRSSVIVCALSMLLCSISEVVTCIVYESTEVNLYVNDPFFWALFGCAMSVLALIVERTLDWSTGLARRLFTLCFVAHDAAFVAVTVVAAARPTNTGALDHGQFVWVALIWAVQMQQPAWWSPHTMFLVPLSSTVTYIATETTAGETSTNASIVLYVIFLVCHIAYSYIILILRDDSSRRSYALQRQAAHLKLIVECEYKDLGDALTRMTPAGVAASLIATARWTRRSANSSAAAGGMQALSTRTSTVVLALLQFHVLHTAEAHAPNAQNKVFCSPPDSPQHPVTLSGLRRLFDEIAKGQSIATDEVRRANVTSRLEVIGGGDDTLLIAGIESHIPSTTQREDDQRNAAITCEQQSNDLLRCVCRIVEAVRDLSPPEGLNTGSQASAGVKVPAVVSCHRTSKLEARAFVTCGPAKGMVWFSQEGGCSFHYHGACTAVGKRFLEQVPMGSVVCLEKVARLASVHNGIPLGLLEQGCPLQIGDVRVSSSQRWRLRGVVPTHTRTCTTLTPANKVTTATCVGRTQRVMFSETTQFH